MEKIEKVEIVTSEAPRNVKLYSQGIVIGPFIYTSGQGPLDPATGAIVQGTIAEQTQLTLRNIEAILRAEGASLQDVVKVTAHLQDLNDFAQFNEAYLTMFQGPILPVRTTVGSNLLGIKVEIDVVAIKPGAVL